MSHEGDSAAAREQPQAATPPRLPPTPPQDSGILPDPDGGPARDDKQETKELLKETRTIEVFQLAGTIILVIVGIVAVCIYYGQLRVFKNQFAEMQKQTGILNAQATQAAKDAEEASGRVERQLGILQQQALAAQVTAEAARKQSVTGAKQLEAADRPWVSVDVSISSPLTYDSSGVHVQFAIVPKNIGRSPAQNIWIGAKLTPAYMFDDLREMQKRICKSGGWGGAQRPDSQVHPVSRRSLYPTNGPATLDCGVPISGD